MPASSPSTEPLNGLLLVDLGGKYFRVGFGGDQLTEIPFIDMLVTLSYLKSLIESHNREASSGKKNFEASFSVKTEFSLAEAADLLTQFRIGTPHDSADYLQIEIQKKPDTEDQDTSPEN